jgi:hypothetical protein
MGISFVLYDYTTGATASALRPAPILEPLAEMLGNVTCAGSPFAMTWGQLAPSFRVGVVQGGAPKDRQAGEVAVNFRDSLPDAPGALAYHDVSPAGVEDVEIGCSLFSTLTTGSESLTVGVSHEVFETLGDPGCNRWALRSDGATLDALELCDFVQNTCTTEAATGFAVSNFVLPAFFDPGAPGPWDALGIMQSQYDLSNGYSIEATIAEENQVQGARRFACGVGGLLSITRRRKAHTYARTRRRGIRL